MIVTVCYVQKTSLPIMPFAASSPQLLTFWRETQIPGGRRPRQSVSSETFWVWNGNHSFKLFLNHRLNFWMSWVEFFVGSKRRQDNDVPTVSTQRTAERREVIQQVGFKFLLKLVLKFTISPRLVVQLLYTRFRLVNLDYLN